MGARIFAALVSGTKWLSGVAQDSLARTGWDIYANKVAPKRETGDLLYVQATCRKPAQNAPFTMRRVM